MKILNYLKKIWWIFLVIVVVFAIFKFTNVFGERPKKNPIKIIDTSLIVEEIKQISELISAQYYGEVHADLYEIYARKKEEIKKINDDPTIPPQEKQKQIRQMYTTYTKLKNYKEGDAPLLVYIARGYVNAVIDLTNIKYDMNENKDTKIKTISILLDSPKLLEPVINPYFIKEENIPGYEIFIGETNTNLSDQEVKEVKLLCSQKLVDEAGKSNIIESAKESAEASIKNFFTLLGYQVEIEFN